MGEDGVMDKERELAISEIAEDAMTFLDIEIEALEHPGGEGYPGDMTPEEVELGRAAIAYLSYRLLLMYRVKHGNVRGNPGGWVGARHYENEVRKEIAWLLGIHVDYGYKYVDEVKRLYKVACDAREADEGFAKRIDSIMEDFEERYDLDARSLGIVFI